MIGYLESACPPMSGPVFVDDRTEAQKLTHRLAWVMTDRFMSGWGGASGGTSCAGWAFPDGHSNEVETWIRSRGDAMRVRLVRLDGYRPTGQTHTHIYVCPPSGPVLRCSHRGCNVPATRQKPDGQIGWTCGNHDEDKPSTQEATT